jgi:hypothetical protein
MEPHRPTRWKAPGFSADVQFYISARPGRSYGKEAIVADSIVDEWVQGLPGRKGTTIVSLLGRKPNGTSEFSFYSFHGSWDTRSQRRDKPLSFQCWLDMRHPDRSLEVVEYPTIDMPDVPQETLVCVARKISKLLSEGRIVVLIDSGGV